MANLRKKIKNKYNNGGTSGIVRSVKRVVLKKTKEVVDKILTRGEPVLKTHEVVKKNGSTQNVFEFSKERKIQVRAPIRQRIPKIFEKSLGNHRVESKTAYTLKNVEIYGKYALTVSESGKFILEEMDNLRTLKNIVDKTHKSYFPNKRLAPQIRALARSKKKYRKEKPKVKKPAINLVPRHFGGPNRSNHGNYAHWIAEDLPRLEAAKKYQNITGIKPQVVIKKDPPSWMVETLRLMGLSSSDLIEWGGGSEIIPKLLVPELKHYHSRDTALDPAGRKWVSRTMKRNIDMSKNKDFPKRVFASRQGSGLRKIANYNEVKSVLKKFEVTPVRNEELSVEDQVKLYDRADIIVGMFGANLANMIFSSSAKVVEIFERGDIRPVYFLTANEMGHVYSYLEGVESKYANVDRPTETVVDTKELANMLEKILQ